MSLSIEEQRILSDLDFPSPLYCGACAADPEHCDQPVVGQFYCRHCGFSWLVSNRCRVETELMEDGKSYMFCRKCGYSSRRLDRVIGFHRFPR